MFEGVCGVPSMIFCLFIRQSVPFFERGSAPTLPCMGDKSSTNSSSELFFFGNICQAGKNDSQTSTKVRNVLKTMSRKYRNA